jgi:threonine aldolase
MNFDSDNQGPVHPKILEALANANVGYHPSYGTDPITEQVVAKIREIFEAPDAAVFLVGTGTAANALVLSTLVNPWDEIYCAYYSHIREDECNAVEFFTGGARITHVGDDDRIDPAKLDQTISEAAPHGIHNAQPGVVSLTQVTDRGGVYSLDEISTICDVAHRYGLKVHLDGARFANAVVSLDCSPADMTWKAGVDAVSFGGTKNGCLGVEAVIFFDPACATEFELRRKRSGHLFSKNRYLAAQMQAYLEDGHWLETATQANAAGQKIFSELCGRFGARLDFPADANMAFLSMARSHHRRAFKAGASYELMGPLDAGPDDELVPCRIVCDWSVSDSKVDRFLSIF